MLFDRKCPIFCLEKEKISTVVSTATFHSRNPLSLSLYPPMDLLLPTLPPWHFHVSPFPRKKIFSLRKNFFLKKTRAWNEGPAPIRHGEFSPLSFVVCEFDREMNGGARIVCFKPLCWQKKFHCPYFPNIFLFA